MRYSLDTTGLSARSLAILARGVRGGDGSTERSLDEMLTAAENAADLDDEAIVELIDEIKASAVALVKDDHGDEAIAKGEKAVEAINALTGIVAEREAEAEASQAKADELLARLAGEASDDEGEGDAADTDAEGTEEGEDEASEGDADADESVEDATDAAAEDDLDEQVEDERVPVAASTAKPKAPKKVAAARTPAVRTRPRRPDLGVRARSETANTDGIVLRASSNVDGVSAGSVLRTAEERGDALAALVEAGMDHRGPQAKVIMASAGGQNRVEQMFGPDRFLNMDERANEQKILAVTSPEAVRASGGQCAPSEVVYTQPIIGVDDRPVKAALANFGASRGGVRLIPPPQLSDVSGGVGTWEMATDLTPGLSTKSLLTMTCPSAVETFVGAITTQMKVGNFRNMYWSEQVDAWIGKLAVQAARVAERRLLTNIGTGSTNVTAAKDFGSARDVLAHLDLMTAGLRSRQRVPGQPIRMIAPAWLLANMRADLVRQAPGDSGGGTERLAAADAEIAGWIAARGINVTWALDGESGQEFGAQVTGPVDGWPSTAIVYLFLEGSWLYLDGGQLNVGTIRDATLVGTNDFIMFSEFMENTAFHGTESLRLSMTICPNGATQAIQTTLVDVCTADS